MAEEFYYVKDHVYNNNKKDNYVHPNAREVAESIVAEWKKPNGDKFVLLKAQMQCGKTSVMRHICYLLNVKKQCEDLNLEEDNVHILINIPDNALLIQTCERMAGVMFIPALNVHHPASRFWKDESNLNDIKKNRVLIIDESHYGAVRNGRIAEICAKINSPLHYDKAVMKENNVYVLLVSATPFAELGINNENHFKTFTLKPGESYYGVQKMLAKNRVMDNGSVSFLKKNTAAEIGTEMEKFLDDLSRVTGKSRGFVFIRENIKSEHSQTWVKNFKSYLDKLPKDQDGLPKFTYFELNQIAILNNTKKSEFDGVIMAYNKCVSKTVWKKAVSRALERSPKAIGIDAILTVRPDRTVFIFVKNMLLAGKTLETPFVRMVIDIPYKNTQSGKVDRLVQGFVGRCCGYGKDHDQVLIVSNKQRIEEYAHWVAGGDAPANPSRRSSRFANDPKKLQSLPNSAYCGPSDLKKYMESDEESSDGSSGDEKLVKKPVVKKPADYDSSDEKPVKKNKLIKKVNKVKESEAVVDDLDYDDLDFDKINFRDWFSINEKTKDDLDAFEDLYASDFEWVDEDKALNPFEKLMDEKLTRLAEISKDVPEEKLLAELDQFLQKFLEQKEAPTLPKPDEDELLVKLPKKKLPVDQSAATEQKEAPTEKIPEGITIVDGITYCANFLQRNVINPEDLLQEILESKAQFFQPRNVNYMKYRGNEIKRTKAFIYKGTDATVPIYVYPGFVYESVLHYAKFEDYGGMMLIVKDIIEKQLKQTINHIIVTKYEQPTDCIGWHNDKVKTIADNSIIAVISLGAKRRFQIRITPTETNKDPLFSHEIMTANGSLINMSYKANLQYQHCVAAYDQKRGDEEGTRVSIVFRNIKNKMRWDQIEAKIKAYHNRKTEEDNED